MPSIVMDVSWGEKRLMDGPSLGEAYLIRKRETKKKVSSYCHLFLDSKYKPLEGDSKYKPLEGVACNLKSCLLNYCKQTLIKQQWVHLLSSNLLLEVTVSLQAEYCAKVTTMRLILNDISSRSIANLIFNKMANNGHKTCHINSDV